jgi:putative aldouronate transport system substrate-binding protein
MQWLLGDSRVASVDDRRLTRRAFVGRLGLLSVGSFGVALLAACSSPTPSSAPPPAAATAPPPPKPTSPPAAAPTTAAPPAAATAVPVAATAPPAPVAPAAAGAAVVGAQPGAAVVVGGVRLPTYVPFTGVQPDSPGSADGMVDPGFKAYPATRVKSVQTPPGDGSDINIMTYTLTAVPNPLEQNPGWQEVNRQVGANLKINITPFADYFGTKLQVTMAGGELPDLFFIITDPGVTIVPEFFTAKVADLTPYLSGDAVKEYPNLAAIPTRSWKTTVYDQKIYGVPVPLRPYFWWYWVHQELLDQDTLKQPTTAAELKDQLTHFTQPNQGLWGQGVEAGPIYAYGLWMGLFTSIFGAPNNWAVDTNGKFSATFETDQYKAAVAYVRDLYSAGIFHPDSSTYNTPSARDAFQARKFAFRYDGLEMYGWRKPPVQLSPAPNVQMVKPFGANGGPGSYWYGRPNFGFVVLPKTLSQDRTRMLLRVLNFLAAPFGTDEDLLLRFGVKDAEWVLDAGGNPQFTDKGQADFMPWRNIVAPAPVAFLPVQAPEFPTLLQDWEKQLLAVGVEDASVGLVSRTYAQKGATANRTLGDGLNDIVTARRPLGDYDALVKDWLGAVGTTAKAEYEQAYAAGQAKS